jgi:hypothetical protein
MNDDAIYSSAKNLMSQECAQLSRGEKFGGFFVEEQRWCENVSHTFK